MIYLKIKLTNQEFGSSKLRNEMSSLRRFRNSIVHEGVLTEQKGIKDWFHAEELERLRELVSCIFLKEDSMGVDKCPLLERVISFPDMAKSASKQGMLQPEISGG